MADGSDRPAWQPQRSVSAQLQNLRNLLNSNRQNFEHQRRLETIEQEISLRSNMLERQGGNLNTHTQDREVPTVFDGLPTSSSPSSLVRSRRRAFRPSERLQRRRERYNQSIRTDPSDSWTNPRRVTPPPTFTDSTADGYGTESQIIREQRFRAKRRKLDDGTFDDETRIISYGDEGRVTPGPLKMEIIPCDGGDYLDSPSGAAQLVLQDDKNVYSTKENKCNMLLKHIGGMPFSLTKIVIKAPSDGFDSPIQEGMVFVAMSDDKLLDSTSQYERYSPKSYRFHHPYRRHDYYRPSQEYLSSSRSPLRSIDRSRYRLRETNPAPPPPPWLQHIENDPELENAIVPGFDVSFTDPSDHEGSPSFTPRSPAMWRDLDAEYSLRSYADRYRATNVNNDNRDNASITSSESEDEYTPQDRERGNNTGDLDEEFAQHRRYLNDMRLAHEGGDSHLQMPYSSRRAQQDWRTIDTSTQRSGPNRIGLRPNGSTRDDPAHSGEASFKTTHDMRSRTPMPSSDVTAPHARFTMAEAQTSIAIVFDPPVAGRYILIKLWASCPASNIDIQSIIPYGYAGPRFFPSVEMR